MSKPNIGSVFPNDALLTYNSNFCDKSSEINTLTNADIISATDLLTSCGISLFSLSKNCFNPFFIPLFVIYIIKYSKIKFTAIIEY